MNHIRVLGPPTIVCGVSGKLKTLRGRNAQIVSRLVLAVPHACSDDALIEALWGSGGLPPDTGSTIRSYMTRVRRSVPELDIVRTERGYRIDVDPHNIDVWQFEAAVKLGMDAWHAREVESAIQHFDGALDLWRGAPWTSLEDSPAAVTDSERRSLSYST